MKGSFRQNPSSGTWYARISAGCHPGGRRRQVRFKARTRRELERIVAEAMTDLERGVGVSRSKIRISELFKEWLASRKSELAFRSFDSYRDQIRLYLEPAFGGFYVSGLTSALITRELNKWKSEPRGDGKSGTRSSRTVRLPLDVLSMAMDYAKSIGLIHRNPVDDVIKPKLGKPRKPDMYPKRVAEVLSAFIGTPLFALIWLAFTSGMRRGEMAALKWCQIDLESQLITRTMTFVCRGKYREIEEPKTEKSQRRIPLSEVTCDILRAHQAAQRSRLERLGYTDFSQVPVFDNGLGQHELPDSITRAYTRTLKRAKVPHVKLHATRHGFSSLATSEKVQRKIISDVLGHESQSFTDSVYTQVDLDALREGTDQVSAAAARLIGYQQA